VQEITKSYEATTFAGLITSVDHTATAKPAAVKTSDASAEAMATSGDSASQSGSMSGVPKPTGKDSSSAGHLESSLAFLVLIGLSALL
jgi:hypothetical protein